MFYPVESLKRGGRFYLCWVADSWPHRFTTITHRQLWSQDIRKIADDLLKVMTNESGRAVNRFSLRLSSQLMRGLVRLYQRKVAVFLGDLCMLNANVFKHTNKKWNIAEVVVLDHGPQPALLPPQEVMREEPDNEQAVTEMIQNSGNIVANVQDITLKESAIPEHPLPPNDGFGEENPDQALQLAIDRTIEMMMHADGSAVQHSGLEAALDTTDVQDRSRLVPPEVQMERISEHDVSVFRKSTGENILPGGYFEKDIPEIPEIPIPELPVPEADKQIEQIETVVEVAEPQPAAPEPQPQVPAREKSVEIELEELEETGPPSKRRRRAKSKLIIDKRIKISSDVLHARIGNPDVELRCEDSADDIIQIRVPVDILFRRPGHAGHGIHSRIDDKLTRLFLRNLGVVPFKQIEDRELEEIMAQRSRRQVRSHLERIEEEPIRNRQPIIEQPDIEVLPEKQSIQLNIEEALPRERQSVQPIEEAMTHADVFHGLPIRQEQIDISDLPTQRLETSQANKRKSDYLISPKRHRSIGFVSFRQSQQLALETAVCITEADKENIPQNVNESISVPQKSLISMLQEAGLADISVANPVEIPQETAKSLDKTARKDDSESSETPLGSLDRTKVSLGESEKVSEAIKSIREQWGTVGTMTKILSIVKAGNSDPITVWYLISKASVESEYRNIIAARCFTSILKLKQHGFIKVLKDPETLEIKDIHLGPKFD